MNELKIFGGFTLAFALSAIVILELQDVSWNDNTNEYVQKFYKDHNGKDEEILCSGTTLIKIGLDKNGFGMHFESTYEELLELDSNLCKD